VSDFNTLLLPIGRLLRQKINKENITNQMVLTDIYRIFHSWNSSKMDHIFRQKSSFNKYKKIEITALLEHNEIKLEINRKMSYRKYTNSSLLIDELSKK
jgi:hypothetical protein